MDFLNIATPISPPTPRIMVLDDRSRFEVPYPRLALALAHVGPKAKDNPLKHLQILIYPDTGHIRPWLVWERRFQITFIDMHWSRIRKELAKCRSIHSIPIYMRLATEWVELGLGNYQGDLGKSIATKVVGVNGNFQL
jgi:hypothetical protein